MRACISTNGELFDLKKARLECSTADIIIAADGGARHLEKIGLKPHVIIGDMDSIDASLWDEDSSIERIVYPAQKDTSDTELAVDLAFNRGCSQVALIAATGGRMDHLFGNICLTAKYPGRVAIIEGKMTLVAIDKSRKLRINGKPGDRVSLFSFGESVANVKASGLKYEIENENLLVGTRGISNEMNANGACVCVSSGLLLAYTENSAS